MSNGTGGTIANANTINLTLGGVHLSHNPDGSFDLPGGIHIEPGAKITENGIYVGGKDDRWYHFRNGRIYERVSVKSASVAIGHSDGSNWKPISFQGAKYQEREVTGTSAPAGKAAGSATGGGRPASDHNLVSSTPPAVPKTGAKTTTDTTTQAAQTGTAASQQIAGGGNTHDFAVDVLKGIGAPVTQSNIQAIMAWSTAESRPGRGASFNPMNTTQVAPEATKFNTVGVRNYTSYKQGVEATVKTLLNGRYAPILAAFHQGNDPFAVGKAVAASPWGTGQGLLNVLTAGHVSSQPIAGGGSGSGSYGPPTGGTSMTGGTTNNMTGSDTGPGTGPSSGTGKLDMADLAIQYGYAAAYLNSIPEIRNLLLQAFSDPTGQWTKDKFAAKLQNTRYFKEHDTAQASWDSLNVTQHPVAVRQVNTLMHELTQQATALGADLSQLELHDLAVTLLSTGKDGDAAFVKDALAAHVQYKAGSPLKGDAGTTARSLESLYEDYGLPVDHDRIGRAVVAILQGKTTLDDFTEEVKKTAKSLYPAMSQAIDQGSTVKDFASPYRNLMSSVLEINPTGIDVTKDPTIRKALSTPDPKTGVPMAQPLWQFEQTLRSDPRWQKTDNARSQYMDVASKILTDMGLAT